MSAGGDELLSAAALAALLGVSPSAVRQWADRNTAPLRPVITPSGSRRYTLAAAAEFVAANPQLNSARAVGQRLAQLRPGPEPPAPAPRPVDHDGELATVARDVRSALDAAMRAVTRQARLAEATAKAHADVVEDLARAITALDGSLSAMTGPRTAFD